jgi:hypothetical protein
MAHVIVHWLHYDACVQKLGRKSQGIKFFRGGFTANNATKLFSILFKRLELRLGRIKRTVWNGKKGRVTKISKVIRSSFGIETVRSA